MAISNAVSLANFSSGDTLTIDPENNRVGIATSTPTTTLDVAGIIRADGISIGGTSPGGGSISVSDDLIVNGNVSVGKTLSALEGSFTGNVSIGGTLTYEDVSNVDSVGLITARSGIKVGPTSGIGITLNPDGSIIADGSATFEGDVTISKACSPGYIKVGNGSNVDEVVKSSTFAGIGAESGGYYLSTFGGHSAGLFMYRSFDSPTAATSSSAFNITNWIDANTPSTVASVAYDGSATFAGDVNIGGSSKDAQLVVGGVYNQVGFIVAAGGTGYSNCAEFYSSSNVLAASIGGDGSATFAGDVQTGNYLYRTGNAGFYFGSDAVLPAKAGTLTSGTVDLGNSSYPWGSASFAGTVSDSIGDLRYIGTSSGGTGNYTLVSSDAGKQVRVNGAHTITIPNNVFGTGAMITIIAHSSSNVSITQGSGMTLYNAADGSSGSFTLAARTVCTILYAEGGGSSIAYIAGGGLS